MNNNCSAGNSISSGIIPHRKNSFFTFLFSFVPGAGEMYMGFMKQGLSLMTLFLGFWLFAFYLIWMHFSLFFRLYGVTAFSTYTISIH